jgi:hypothetical protein
MVFSAGSDFAFRCWKIDQQKDSMPPTKLYQSKFVANCDSATVVEESGKGDVGPSDPGLPLRRQASEASIGSVDTPGKTSTAKHARKPKPFLKHCASVTASKEQAVAECRLLFEKMTAKDEKLGPTESHLGLYLGRQGVMGTLADETRRCSDPETKVDLMLLKGDVEAAVDLAIANGVVCSKVLAAAGLAGVEVWHRAVEALISSSLSAGDTNNAVQYMLMLNRVPQAVSTLVGHNRYREAVAVATTRLPAGDTLTHQLYEKWAIFQENSGHFEGACECYLAIEDLDSAVRVLTARTAVPNFLLALHILLTRGDAHLETSAHYARLTVFHCLVSSDTDSALSVCDKHLYFRMMTLPVKAFVLIKDTLGQTGLDVVAPNDAFVLEASYEPVTTEEAGKAMIEACVCEMFALVEANEFGKTVSELLESVTKMRDSIPVIKPRMTNAKLCILIAFECCLAALHRKQDAASDITTVIEELLNQLRPLPEASNGN